MITSNSKPTLLSRLKEAVAAWWADRNSESVETPWLSTVTKGSLVWYDSQDEAESSGIYVLQGVLTDFDTIRSPDDIIGIRHHETKKLVMCAAWEISNPHVEA